MEPPAKEGACFCHVCTSYIQGLCLRFYYEACGPRFHQNEKERKSSTYVSRTYCVVESVGILPCDGKDRPNMFRHTGTGV